MTPPRPSRVRRLAACIAGCALAASLGAETCRIVVGTRKDGPGRGISIAEFDLQTGSLATPRLAFETPQPVFWVPDATGRHLYVCHGLDSFQVANEGFVSALSFEPESGALSLLNQAAIGGRGASHVNLDHSGRWLLEASYRSGHVAIFALNTDGSIGARSALVLHEGRSVHPQRQTSPHPHAIYPDPENRYILVPDLGLDQIVIYRFDTATGTLQPHQPASLTLPSASGPRHLAWHPDGRHAYATLELANAVAVLTWEATSGRLALKQTIPTLAPDHSGENTAAEIAVHPSGRYVYASNRGADNSIAVFAVSPEDGTLAAVERVDSRGLWPRNFSIDRAGRWMVVSNHDSDNLVVFSIDLSTGQLTPVGDPVAAPNPFGTRFLEPGP